MTSSTIVLPSAFFPRISTGKRPNLPGSHTQPKKPRIDNIHSPYTILERAVNFLHQKFQSRTLASNAFPPEISPKHIRACIARYEKEISSAAKRAVCSACGRLIPIANIYAVDNGDKILDYLRSDLDDYSQHDNT